MSAFQFTPNGIVPLGQAAPVPIDTAVSGGAALLAAVQRATEQHLQQATAVSVPKAATPKASSCEPDAPLTGKQLKASIKARIRELDKQLAKMPAMQDERAYLQRLLDAVKAKPGANPEPKHPVLRMANGTRT